MKKTLVRWMGSTVVFGVLAGWCTPAQAAPYNAPAQESKYKSPEDMLDMIPFLGQIPRTFLVGDGFKMRLTPKELRIDHMGHKSKSPASRRNCLMGFSYTTPVAGFFTYRVDIPLMSSDTPAVADWTRSSLGDYVLYFSRTPVDHASLRFVLTAKF